MPTISELASAKAGLKAPSTQRIAPTIVPEMSIPQIIDSLNSDVASKKRKVIERLSQDKYLTQGYPLLNREAYTNAVNLLQEKIASHDGSICKKFLTMFGPYVDIEADRKILQLLTDPNAYQKYVSEGTLQREKRGWSGESVIKDKKGAEKTVKDSSLKFKDKSDVANTKYKLKILFMQFERMKVAQAELLTLCKEVSSLFNGKLSTPPGAFHGLKSFSGALDKITNRERSSDFGDLKDVARMTVEFEDEHAMNLAREYLEDGKEFEQIKGYAKALKNRYGTSEKGSVHNSKALKSGYQDIKFFLKLSNGIIGELQLNTKGMLIAKEKEHLIYDLTRAAPKGTEKGAGFTLNNKEDLLDHLVHKLNDEWFVFVGQRAPKTLTKLYTMKAMMARMAKRPVKGSFTVLKQEVEAMNVISRLMYTQIGKGEGVKLGTSIPQSGSTFSKVSRYFFS